MPRLSKPSAARQGQRLSPQFRTLVEAFDAERMSLSDGRVDEVDPELVVVFDLANSVKDFRNAVQQVDGLEFLSEFLDEEIDPDDDFFMTSQGERTENSVQHSLYLVMSNSTAVTQLMSLFRRWQQDPSVTFEYGLGRFKKAFEQLRAIRRWSAADRVRDTRLIDSWREHLAVVGQAVNLVPVEVELWYRREADKRADAEAQVEELIRVAGGSVTARADLSEIAYHALLAQIPAQQVEEVLRDGAEAIELLNADEIMFVSPYAPMTVTAPELAPTTATTIAPVERVPGLPRIALLDGLPLINHDALTGRLTIDDPDGLGASYPARSRHHGTAMASLIVHGDLSNPGEPLDRPLYVRPILQPHPVLASHERVAENELLPDLVHRAIRRIVQGDGRYDAAAPSVRIVNISIGAESRALVRRMSPVGRLLDWLAVEYNLLFVVSAGNHHNSPVSIPAAAARDLEAARAEAAKAARATSRVRGILPPGDSINALTIGATHADEAGDVSLPDTVWDVVAPGAPALYGAVGPGVGRSIKPDVYHSGGRALYQRPVAADGDDDVALVLANTARTGPGNQVSAPSSTGATGATVFTHGTSNATALVTREASMIFDLLAAGADRADDFAFPDALYHPVLARALLVHASSWGDPGSDLRTGLGLGSTDGRRELTTLLGYGSLRPERLGSSATNRAVLIAGRSIGREERHTYRVPLPVSLRSKAEWHRFTVTLAYMAPTVGQLNRYRGAKVFFEKLDDKLTGGTRIDADHNAVRRGSVQHEIVDGLKAIVFDDGESLPVHVECMDDARRLRAGATVRYGLVVSVETAVATSTTIHDEIRAQLRARAQAQARPRIQP